jgi:hypothetical protein
MKPKEILLKIIKEKDLDLSQYILDDIGKTNIKILEKNLNKDCVVAYSNNYLKEDFILLLIKYKKDFFGYLISNTCGQISIQTLDINMAYRLFTEITHFNTQNITKTKLWIDFETEVGLIELENENKYDDKYEWCGTK